MNYSIEKTEHYALATIDAQVFDIEIATPLEKSIVSIFRDGIINMIVDCGKVTDIDATGLNLLRKAARVFKSENGVCLVATKNDDVIDKIDGAMIEGLIILPTSDECIDAVFMNELENDFKEENDDEFGLTEEDGFTEQKF